MKISIKREQLLEILRDVQGAVQARSTIPILSHVKIEASEDKMRLTATDMGISATEHLEITTTTDSVKVEEGGAITAPAQQLNNILEKMEKDSTVLLEKKDDSFLNIKSGNSQFNLRSLPVDDFPKVDEPKEPVVFKIATKEFQRLLTKTSFSMSKDEIRYYLNGVYLHHIEEDGKPLLRAVATDGHRMALAHTDAPKGADKLPSCIIPAKAVREMDRLFVIAKEEIEIAISKTLISFTMGTAKLVSRLVEGSFPDYGKVIPDPNGAAEVEVDSGELITMIERVCAVSDEPIKAVKTEIKNGEMSLSVAAADNANAQDKMKVKHKNDIAVGFNSQYLLEILRQEEGTIHISLNGDSKPTRITSKNKNNLLYVLMPMRV